MKFRVARDDLAEAVAWVAKSLPSRPPVPVLGGILLEVRGSTLTVAGFDYEVSTRAEVSVDSLDALDDDGRRGAERAGAGVRPAARRDHQGAAAKPVDVAVDGPRVTIVGGSARFTLPTMPVEDYPAAAADARRVGHGGRRRRSPRRSRRPRWRPAATTPCRC